MRHWHLQDEHYQKTGQDRTLWLLPIKWALTILWPSGYFVNFIVGGHAKLTEKDKALMKWTKEFDKNFLPKLKKAEEKLINIQLKNFLA